MIKLTQLITKQITSIALPKRLNGFLLLFASLMFAGVGQASATIGFQVTDTGNLVIKMVSPNEHLALRGNGGDVGDLDIELNRGEYTESLSGIRNIVITAWGTRKLVDVSGITISGDLTIRTGYENDSISLFANSIRGKLKIVTGGGNDYVGINRIYVGLIAEIFTGAGDDYVPLRDIYFEDSVRLLTGAGDDAVTIYRTEFDNHANIKTGDGNDYLISNSATTRANARYFAGAGEDFVILYENVFDENLTVYTGADNDTIEMTGNIVLGPAVLGGAAGLADVFQYDEQNQFFKQSEILGFETFSPIDVPQY